MNRTALVFGATGRSGRRSEPVSRILRRLVPRPLRRADRWPEHSTRSGGPAHRRFIQRSSTASNADPLDRLRRAGLI